MMNKIVVAFVYLLPLFSYTQKGGYIEPIVHAKVGFTSASSGMQTKIMRQSYHTNFATRSMRMNGVSIGVNIGYNFNESKQRLSFGVTLDKTTLGYSSYTAPTPTKEKDIGVNTLFDAEVSYTRFHLTYEQRLLNKGELMYWYIIAGIGVVLQDKQPSVFAKERTSEIDFYASDTMDIIDNRIYTEGYRQRAVLPFVPSFTLGLKTDIYSKKGKYLLSSSLFYVQGIDELAHLKIFHHSADGKARKMTPNGIYSKGSGIYLQLSRRLNIRFDKKQKENLEQYY